MNVLFVRPPIYLWRSAGISTSTQNHRGIPIYDYACILPMSTGYYLSGFYWNQVSRHSRKIGLNPKSSSFSNKNDQWTIFELGSDISSDLSVELPSRNWLNLITGSVLWAYRRSKTRTIIPLLMDWVFDVVDASLTRSLNGTRFHGTTFGTSNLIVIQRNLFTS